MIETIKLAAGVTLLAVQTEKFKSGCFSFNGALAGYARHLDAP